MLRTHFRWREAKQVDELFYNRRDNPVFPEERELAEVYPIGYWGLDNHGRIIYYERIGATDVKQALRIVTRQRYLEYITYQYEKLIWTRFASCRPDSFNPSHRDQTLMLIDLQGMSWDHLSSTTRGIFRDMSRLASENYPDIMGRTFILNAPRIFYLAWAGLKGFLPSETRKKITVIANNHKKTTEAINHHIRREFLPDFLGGRVRSIRGVVDYGPWRTEPEFKIPPRPVPALVKMSTSSTISHESFVTCEENAEDSSWLSSIGLTFYEQCIAGVFGAGFMTCGAGLMTCCEQFLTGVNFLS